MVSQARDRNPAEVAVMEKKYIARNIPFTPDKLELLEAYRARLEAELGFKVSFSDAVVHSLKKLAEFEKQR